MEKVNYDFTIESQITFKDLNDPFYPEPEITLDQKNRHWDTQASKTLEDTMRYRRGGYTY